MMESLQLSQVLADLSTLGAAEPDAAAAIVSASTPISHSPETPRSSEFSPTHLQPPQRPGVLQRAWSSEATSQTKVDKYGRRILSGATSPRIGSAASSIPGTPRRGCESSEIDDDLERASTLMALYDIRAKLKQQDNSSLLKAREKINALAAKQQAQQAAEQNMKAAEELRKKRYSFPKTNN